MDALATRWRLFADVAVKTAVLAAVRSAIAEEREACAKICDDLPMDLRQENDGGAARDAAAAAIRGRT